MTNLSKGTRFEVLEDIETDGLVHWNAPFTSGFRSVIPKGTILKTLHDYPASSSAVGFVPEDYKGFEQKHVPEADRKAQKYAGYSFVFLRSAIGVKLKRL
jgi:hypothetical protein